MDRIVQLLINAAALFAAVFLVPGLDFAFEPELAWLKFLLVAFIFGLVNTFVRPILRILTFPITMMTLGLFLIVINALMFLLVDAISDRAGPRPRGGRLLRRPARSDRDGPRRHAPLDGRPHGPAGHLSVAPPGAAAMSVAPWPVGLLFGLSLAVVIMLAGPLLLFNPLFTSVLQARHGVPAAFDTSQAEVDRVTGEILGDLFVGGSFDAAFEGDAPLLNDRERSHMGDVSRLVQLLVGITLAALLVAVVTAAAPAS